MAFVPIVSLAIAEEEDRRSLRYRVIRPSRMQAFGLPDSEFISLFRLNKQLVCRLIEMVRPALQPRSFKRNVFSVETKVLCALRFFATGSYQKSVANDIMVSMCQQSVSRIVKQVSNAINEHLDEWLRFPVLRSDQDILKQEFYEYCGFPAVVGAVDCTHVAIIAPEESQYMQKNYLNRKNFYSMNVQIICDMQQEIFAISTRYPGSVHDSHIWRTSVAREVFESGLLFSNQNAWLLGDSGYPLEAWLMTPIQDAAEGSPEANYNKSHSRGRSVIERCNGTLKSRFRCLLKHRTLHYSPPIASTIINSCAVLHNMCIKEKIAVLDTLVDEDDTTFTSGTPDPAPPNISRQRDTIVQTFFN